jgi:hypothetical protein
MFPPNWPSPVVQVIVVEDLLLTVDAGMSPHIELFYYPTEMHHICQLSVHV